MICAPATVLRRFISLCEAVSGHDPRQQELYPVTGDVLAERVANLLAATPYFASYAQGRYAKDIELRNVLMQVVGFFDAMWENRKGASTPQMLSSLAEVWPYTGPCYRIIGVSISRIPSHKIDQYPTLKRMLIGRFDPKDAAARSEFYDYLTHGIDFRDYESWAKSLDGINYFDQLRHAHTRNVIYKASMHGGLDFQAMAETLHEIGVLKSSDRLAKTIGAQEVIGAVVSPVPIRWKMVKWFREDHPADMVIDGKKYRWTDKGTLARVGPARR